MEATLHVSRSPGLARAGIPQATSFQRWVEAGLRIARRRKPAELSLRLSDIDEAQDMNLQYRGRDYATNVLSFPAELPPGVKLPLLGDLVICPAVVAREAGEQAKPLRDHYAHLTIHGVLHLLGFDHENDADAEHMEALERQALATLGIADPYREQ